MQEQYELAETVRQFIKDSGLQQWYVAQKCHISATRLSSWLNHHRAITEKQVEAISDFMADYERRMS